jgi:hypothetical protein
MLRAFLLVIGIALALPLATPPGALNLTSAVTAS